MRKRKGIKRVWRGSKDEIFCKMDYRLYIMTEKRVFGALQPATKNKKWNKDIKQ